MKYGEILSRCPLFSGMSESETEKELNRYRASFRSYEKGETLLALLQPVERFAVVLSGRVQVMQDDMNGRQLIMITVEPGQTFAESLCFQGASESPVYAQALTNCEVCWLDAGELRLGPSARFITMLTCKTLSMNDRIQVLSKITLREKLNTLFSQYAARFGNRFELPFDRESLASYIGANRSALSRELSSMRREGIIALDKNEIVLLRQEDRD